MNITLRKAPSSGFCTSTPIRKILNTDVKLEITVCQRLHPDWRMIPHLEIFGWTEKHQQLEQYLRMQIKNGVINNLYFGSEKEYTEAEFRLKNPEYKFVGRPVVNTVDGIIMILEKYESEISSPPYCKENILGR
ncbi:hypothetical protein V9T40_003873 [Parthenolecanium corni]|uniref:Uncharacterized protein n=1 Tax=Parthenolecanium corni TaxID=536013 RepID=A0AAN9YA45_9HEMI